jgi:hypothetical protein
MPRYLDPKNDLIFNLIFGEHSHLLKSFLNALMPLEEDQRIESPEYLPAEQVPDNPANKNSIVNDWNTDGVIEDLEFVPAEEELQGIFRSTQV